MNFLFNPVQRQAAGRSFPQLTTTAMTFLGLRLTRDQILRISGLLTLRTLFATVDVPLHASVTAYAWNLAFSLAQASVALAATANLLDWGGIAGALARRFFPPGDSAFVDMYGRIVFFGGPLIALFETAVIVYETMRLARILEARMWRGGLGWRRSLLSLAGINVLVASFLAYALSETPAFSSLAFVLVSLILFASFHSDDGNVVEGSLLSLYALVTIWTGIVEEAGMGNKSVTGFSLPISGLNLTSGEVRASLLLYSMVILLVTMMRGEHFIRVLLSGHDALQGQEADGRSEDKNELQRTAFSTATLIGGTFRLLVWCNSVRSGEYLALLCRTCQAILVLGFYVVFLSM